MERERRAVGSFKENVTKRLRKDVSDNLRREVSLG